MAKLFVSYSRKDAVTERRITEAIEAAGQDVWIDWEDIPPASDWLEQIFRGIERSDAFIFLVSPDSNASEVCKVEVAHAAKNNKRIIPVVLREVPPQDTNDAIRKVNWVFLRNDGEFETGIQRLLTAIELDFEWVEEHTRLQNRALIWHRKKESSLFLRGADLWRMRRTVAEAIAKKKDPQPTELQRTYLDFSRRHEQRNWLVIGLASAAIVALTALSYVAVTQRNLAQANQQKAEAAAAEAQEFALMAQANAREAEDNAARARENAQKAIREKQIAERARQRAEENERRAAAQRSTARAQIYQFRPGDLYTSTLLAIDSYSKLPSSDAEEILRKNISLLPLPVEQMTHTGAVNAIEFNVAGDVFVTAGAEGTVCAWQVSDGENKFCRDSPGSVSDAVFVPAANMLVTGDSLGNILFLNAQTGDLENELNLPSPIRDVEVDRRGQNAAFTTEDGHITLIDLGTRARSGIELRASDIKFAKFSPNGLQVATGSADGVISIWNLNQPGNTINNRKHRGEILALAFSPNRQMLVSGGADGAAVALDTRTGAELFRCLHNDQVKDIAFNRDGAWFVTVSNDRTIRMWDANTGAQLLSMSQSNFVQRVRISENGQWIASAGDDKTVRVWSAVTGAELFQIPIKAGATALAFSRDGKSLLAGDRNGNVYLWDISIMPTPVKTLQFNGVTKDAAFSPTGTWIAASDDRRVWLLNPGAIPNLTTRQSGTPYGNLLANINHIVWGPTDLRLGALTDAYDIVVYNTRTNTGKTIKPERPTRAFVFSSDERRLFTGDASGRLQVWDAVSGLFIETAVTYPKPVNSMTAASDLLAVGIENEIHILDTNTFTELDRLDMPGEPLLLVFSPDGSWLAAGNANGQIQVWRQSGNRFTFQKSISRDAVTALAFDPSNRLLAVGSPNTVYLLDLASYTEYNRIPHSGTVNAVSFSSDGNTLITASLKLLQFWDVRAITGLTPDDLVAAACGRLSENFSPAQWELLFGNEPYEALCPDLRIP
jgi:WD40 repeat protein